MKNVLAVLLLCSAGSARAQSYGAAPAPQAETGTPAPPAVPNAVGTQQNVTNQTGINNFTPMRAPAAEEPRAAASTAPDPSSKKTTAARCRTGYELVNGSCRRACAQGETRDAKGNCAARGSEPSMPQMGGAGEDEGAKKAAEEKAAAAAEVGGRPGASVPAGSGACAGPGGLCGDSMRVEKTAQKLSAPFKTGLQPGGPSTAPEARENPSGYSGELGKVGSWDFVSPRRRAESAAAEAAKAGGEYPALQSDVQGERAAFIQAYGGIKVGVSMEAGLQDVLNKLTLLEGDLSALKASGSRVAGSVRSAAERTAMAADAGARALDVVRDSFQTTGQFIQSANQTYGGFQTLRQRYAACTDPYTRQQCRTAVAAQASSTKASYLPDPAARSAEGARGAAKEARQSLSAAETAQAEAERALAELAQSGRAARARLTALKQDFVARFRPSSDPNQIARTRAFAAIVEKFGAFLTAAESIRTGTLVPASGGVQDALKGLRSSMDGRP